MCIYTQCVYMCVYIYIYNVKRIFLACASARSGAPNRPTMIIPTEILSNGDGSGNSSNNDNNNNSNNNSNSK